MELNQLAYSKTFGYDLHYILLVSDSHAYLAYDPRS